MTNCLECHEFNVHKCVSISVIRFINIEWKFMFKARTVNSQCSDMQHQRRNYWNCCCVFISIFIMCIFCVQFNVIPKKSRNNHKMQSKAIEDESKARSKNRFQFFNTISYRTRARNREKKGHRNCIFMFWQIESEWKSFLININGMNVPTLLHSCDRI